MNALNAGVDSIVHAFWMDEECADEMVKRGVYWEPTNVYVSVIKDYAIGRLPDYMDEENPGGVPEWMFPKAISCWEDKVKSFRKWVDKGIKISFASDTGFPWLRQSIQGGLHNHP